MQFFDLIIIIVAVFLVMNILMVGGAFVKNLGTCGSLADLAKAMVAAMILAAPFFVFSLILVILLIAFVILFLLLCCVIPPPVPPPPTTESPCDPIPTPNGITTTTSTTTTTTERPTEPPDLRDKYCNMISCGDKNHTMCKYTSDRINIAKCGRCRAVIVDDILISDILAMHNGVRDEIAQGMIEGAHGLLPPAASSESIPDLEWHDELEMIARRWVNQCESGRDECRDTSEMKVGQNVGFGRPCDKVREGMQDSFLKWLENHKYVEKESVEKFPADRDNRMDEFTQIIWGRTKYIGCWYILCHKYRVFTMRVVCNYGPAGNIPGEPIYLT